MSYIQELELLVGILPVAGHKAERFFRIHEA